MISIVLMRLWSRYVLKDKIPNGVGFGIFIHANYICLEVRLTFAYKHKAWTLKVVNYLIYSQWMENASLC